MNTHGYDVASNTGKSPKSTRKSISQYVVRNARRGAPGEVTEARREEEPTLDDNSVVGSRVNQVGPPRDDKGRDDRGIDRE